VEHNVGSIDAVVRWVLAAVFFGVSLLFNQNWVVALVTAVATVVMVATALTRSCPIYWVFGFTTCPRSTAALKGQGG
jgi:hypothetical protein